MRLFFEELVLFFVIFEFWVAKSGIVLQVLHVCGRPLVHAQDYECVSKEISELLGSGGARLGKTGGRATPRKKKVFDCTMGFQGEDPATKLPYNYPLHHLVVRA